MTIHHDKLAYGKLAKTAEEISEEKLMEMIKTLNGREDGLCGEEAADKSSVRDGARKIKRGGSAPSDLNGGGKA